MRNISDGLAKMAGGRLPVIDTEVELADFERTGPDRGTPGCSELNRHGLLLAIESAPNVGSDWGELLWPQGVLNDD
jgi:hypothetical protein